MHIVLVDNFFYLRSVERVEVTVSPHLGLMSLASVLESVGHVVSIVDPKLVFSAGDWRLPCQQFYEAWAHTILSLGADIVGFTALGRTLPHAVAAATRIKALRPELPVLVGGPHATILGPALLEAFDCFDVVVRHEAETTIVRVVEAVHAGRDLGNLVNLVFRDARGVVSTPEARPLPDMDDLPFPAYHLYPREALMGKELAIEAGRGCPFACTFCSTANFFQRRYRLKSNRRLIEEMELLHSRYGTVVIDLNHDLFGLNKKALRDFCRQVTGRGLKWKCSMRPDTMDVAMLGDLVRAGCVSIYFGIESGSPRMQKIIAKKLDLQDTAHSIEQALDVGLVCTASFITGFPEETDEDLNETLDMIGRLSALSSTRLLLQLHVLSPEPGSDLAAREQTIRFDGIGPEMDDLVDIQLIAQHPQVFSVFHHFETRLSRQRVLYCSAFVTFVMPEVGHALVRLITDVGFQGRLSRLLNAVIPQDTDADVDFNRMIQRLWAGLEWVAANTLRETSYIGELVRFSRIMAACRRNGGKPASEVGEILVAPFQFEVADIARRLLEARRDTPNPTPKRTWYAFQISPAQAINIVRLNEVESAEMAALYAGSASRPAGTREDLASLGAMSLCE
jgi:hypothetical protein